MALSQVFSQEHFPKFSPLLGTGSSSYSSFSGGGSEDKAQGPPSNGASSPRHHSLYMEWRDAADFHKSESSWEGDADSPGVFGNPASFQQGEMSLHQNNSSSPVYSRTMSSCFSEPYEPLPPSSSPSVAYGDSRRGSMLAPEEEELICRWRQLSVEDLHLYSSPGRASPYSFSEQHFSVRPAKIRLGPMYSSFQEGADYYHLHHQRGAVMEQAWAEVGATGSQEIDPGMRQSHSQAHLYRAEGSQGSEHSDREGAGPVAEVEEEYPEEPSPNSSTESLQQRALELGAELQHYQVEMHSLPSELGPQSPTPATPPLYAQKFGSLGLTRKDSLTKAQLYGTLLN